MTKKILYLMHVPWDWIKQRPHFLAEHLAKHCDVHVYYRFYKVPFEGRLVANYVPAGLKVTALPVLPLNRLAPIARINTWIIDLTLRSTIREFDSIWITHPEMFETVEAILPAGINVIYDCMDNHLEFSLVKNNHRLSQRLLDCERRLLERSSLIIASSQRLKDVLLARHGIPREIHVLNNGIAIADTAEVKPLPAKIEELLRTPGFKLTYIGTINEWFDTDLILATVERFKEITMLLFGPCEIALPDHPRIVQAGPIEHHHIYEVMDKSDALVMPFTLNELIQGVNPVKLYEYVFSCKPALAVQYPESAQFGDYVYLYKNRDEFFSQLAEIVHGIAGAKKSCAECKAFAQDNTWEKRVESIINQLN